MDLVDFFENACLTTRQGDVLDLTTAAGSERWLHSAALARRLGFSDEGQPQGYWLNARHAQSPVIRWVRKDDFSAWAALFLACFNHDISFAQWAWKYRDTDKPGIVVLIQGRMIAFYGGMPRAVSACGVRQTAIQIGDVMVHPDFRGKLSRRGPFQMAASTFLEQTLAMNAPYWVGFGFPNQRAMQLARHLHLYRPVDQLVELFWQPREAFLPWWLGLSHADASQLDFVNQLWDEMRLAMPDSLVGVRNAQYVQQRYVEHPAHTHSLLKVYNKLNRQVYGLAVLRQLSDDRQEILDVVGDPKHFAKLIMAAQAFAAQVGSPSVSAWMTESHAHLLMSADARLNVLDVFIPTNDWVAGNATLDPNKRWWLTCGDTDFR